MDPTPVGSGSDGWGDRLHAALARVGITPERVTQWLGRPCRCRERQDKWNRIGAWTERVLRGRMEGAAAFLERILDEGD